MALLGKIRNQFGWMMMGLVILGVGGFLFMDVSSVGSGGMTQRNRVVGEVNGENIYTTDFETVMDSYEGADMSTEQKRQFAWNEILSNTIIQQQADKLGLKVTEAEMEDMYVGENISPILLQQFQQAGTGYDRQQIEQSRLQYNQLLEKKELNRQEANFINTWRNLENQVRNERLSSKYVNMLKQGMYAPGWMTSAEYARNNTSYDFKYVQIPYTELPNTNFVVAEEELTSYINEHPKQFEREATVSLEYVIFEVKPTQADIDTIKADMQKIANKLAENTTAKEDTATIQLYEGNLDFKYYTKETWTGPEEIKDSLFAMDEGDVIGPYEEGGAFKVAKITDVKQMPDSVKVKQIFKPAGQGSMQEFQQAQRFYMELDSLRKELVAGNANFDSLLVKHSLDPASKADGGSIGWVKKGNKYGSRFVDQVFANLEQDTFIIVQSDRGLHLAKATQIAKSNERGVRLATIQEPIIPSPKTEDAVEGVAHNFMVNNRSRESLINAVKDSAGLRTATATGLEINDFEITPQLSGSRASDIIKWAHKEGEVGGVADDIFSFSDPQNAYVSQVLVVALTAKSPEGLASIEDEEVKFEVESIVRNIKKAAFVKDKLKGVSSLDEVATKVPEASGVQDAVRTAYGSATFNQITEPKVLAMAAKTAQNKVSAPVAGDEGVYVIQVINKTDAPPMADVKTARKMVSSIFFPISIRELRDLVIEALKAKFEIEDNRAEVY